MNLSKDSTYVHGFKVTRKKSTYLLHLALTRTKGLCLLHHVPHFPLEEQKDREVKITYLFSHNQQFLMERLRDFYTSSQELYKYINNFRKMLGCVLAKKRKSTNGLHSNLHAVIGQTKVKAPLQKHQSHRIPISFYAANTVKRNLFFLLILQL